MTIRTISTAAALAALACLSFSDAAFARGGGIDLGGRGAGAGGGAARPRGRPSIPGRSGATGEALRKERRARTKRLGELGATDARGEDARPAPSTSRPTTPQRGRPGGGTPTVPATPDTSLVHLHHGKVRMFGDLARVDLTLEVQNVGEAVMEWQRDYAIDPQAELIGAVLMRRNQLPIAARTLTTSDALQCYARVRMPPRRPTERPRRPKDPLLVTRPERDTLHVRIWPIAAGETIRAEFTFVTPLRGQGARRIYRDVMGGPTRETPRRARETERPEVRPEAGVTVNHAADWLIEPGELVLSTVAADGMEYGGRAGERLKFTGVAATRAREPAPTVPFLSPTRTQVAQLVGTRRLSQRVAVFRFDPALYLKRKGFVMARDMTLELKAVRRETRRFAPDTFQATDAPLPVTAEVLDPNAGELPFRVRVLDRFGNEVLVFDESMPIERPEIDDAMQDAVCGWHRARLAARVFDWAGTNARRREEAIRYAVDLGVLMPGIAAIAIPADERQRLTRRQRRLYETDGVPLGAPRGEAAVKQAPRGAFDDDFE